MTEGFVTASERDWGRLAAADRLVVLVGGFDGSGNVGDMLQTAAALIRVREASPDALVAVVVESRFAEAETWVDMLPSEVVVLRYDDTQPGDRRLEFLPALTLLYLTGGGYVNGAWGDRKLDHVETINSLVRAGGAESLSHVMTSGLQLSSYEHLSAWTPWLQASRPLIVRDEASAEIGVKLGTPSADVFVGSDDALGALRELGVTVDDTQCVNVHLNVEPYGTDAPSERVAAVTGMLAELAGSGSVVRSKLLIAFDDARIGERDVAAELVSAYDHSAADGRANSIDFEVVSLPRNVALGIPTELGALGTITCSYHVGLISLTNNVPTLMLVDNPYYEQKMTALADIFGLGGVAVIRKGEVGDVAARFEEVRARLSANFDTVARTLAAQSLATECAIGRSIAKFERDVTWSQLQSVYPSYRSAVEESAELRRRVRLLSHWLTEANSRTP